MPLLDLFADDDAPPAELDFALKGKKGAKGSGEGDGAGSKKVGGSARARDSGPCARAKKEQEGGGGAV